MVLQATLYTLAMAVAVSALAGAAGLILAWLVSRTDLPGGRSLSGMLAVPYALPAYLLGMAWVVLGNPTVGLLKAFLPAQGSYGFWGIVFVEASVACAFPYLELRAGFDRLDPALEEAARMSGARPWRVFRDISLPLLWPALLNGMCLAFLYAVSSFGVPAILGLPVRQMTLTTLIYSKIKLGGISGLEEGLRLSALLLALALAVLGVSAWLSRRRDMRFDGAISGGRSSRRSVVRLGTLKGPAALGSWGYLAMAVALPWVALGISALAPVAGDYDPANWTLKHLQYVLTLGDFKQAVFNSFVLAVGMSMSVTALGFGLGFLAKRSRLPRVRRLSGWMIELLGVPFATPGTVLALGVVFGAAVLSRLGLPLNQPMLLLAFAYSLKYAAVGARQMVTAFGQVDPVLEEAARVCGAGTRELLVGIWAPLLKQSLGAAFLLTLLPMVTELTMSVLLTGPGAATLGTVLFDLQEYADQPSAAALAWILLTVALMGGFLTRRKSYEPA